MIEGDAGPELGGDAMSGHPENYGETGTFCVTESAAATDELTGIRVDAIAVMGLLDLMPIDMWRATLGYLGGFEGVIFVTLLEENFWFPGQVLPLESLPVHTHINISELARVTGGDRETFQRAKQRMIREGMIEKHLDGRLSLRTDYSNWVKGSRGVLRYPGIAGWFKAGLDRSCVRVGRSKAGGRHSGTPPVSGSESQGLAGGRHSGTPPVSGSESQACDVHRLDRVVFEELKELRETKEREESSRATRSASEKRTTAPSNVSPRTVVIDPGVSQQTVEHIHANFYGNRFGDVINAKVRVYGPAQVAKAMMRVLLKGKAENCRWNYLEKILADWRERGASEPGPEDDLIRQLPGIDPGVRHDPRSV